MLTPSPVLILLNALHPGGAEQYIVTVSARLAELGVSVVVAGTPGSMVDKLDPRVRFEPTDLIKPRANVLRAVGDVRKLITKHKPKLILTNSLSTTWVAKLAVALNRIPIVAVAHGWPPDMYPIIARPLAAANLVVPVSSDVARHLGEHGCPTAKMRVVPNGINLSAFPQDSRSDPHYLARRERTRAAIGLESDDVAMISVGRFIPSKRQDRLIETLKQLAPTHPHLRLLLVGYGAREAALRELIAAHKLDHLVKLLIKRDDVPDLLVASDLFVSASEQEGMPIAVIEAMAACLPIVAMSADGIAELLDDGAGIVTELGDRDAFVAKIGMLLDDDALRQRFGDRARERARTQFSQTMMFERLLSVVREAAGREPV